MPALTAIWLDLHPADWSETAARSGLRARAIICSLFERAKRAFVQRIFTPEPNLAYQKSICEHIHAVLILL